MVAKMNGRAGAKKNNHNLVIVRPWIQSASPSCPRRVRFVVFHSFELVLSVLKLLSSLVVVISKVLVRTSVPREQRAVFDTEHKGQMREYR